MEQQLLDARHELDRHHSSVMAAASLSAVESEAGSHDSRMGRIMGDMDHAMAMMSHCSGSGMGEMHDMIDGMESETRNHVAILEGAADLDAAEAACGEHVTRMSAMVDRMNDALGRTRCPMMNR